MSQQSMQFDTSDVILYVLAFFLPPFPVLIRVGFCTNQFLLNVLLTMLFGIPGTLHSLYIVYVTSPITGSPERRVRNLDYERVIDSEAHAPDQDNYQQGQGFQQTDGAVASSSEQPEYSVAPPPYDDSKDFTSTFTDNKVQKP